MCRIQCQKSRSAVSSRSGVPTFSTSNTWIAGKGASNRLNLPSPQRPQMKLIESGHIPRRQFFSTNENSCPSFLLNAALEIRAIPVMLCDTRLRLHRFSLHRNFRVIINAS